MTVSVKFNENPRKSKPDYPWIGYYNQDKKIVVLFTKYRTGTFIGSSTLYQFGLCKDDWSEDSYLPLVGDISLSND